MAISELQMSLIGAGVAGVIGVVLYNKWQEGRHRRQAEKAFRSEHPDVLLEPGLGERHAREDDSQPDATELRELRAVSESAGPRNLPLDTDQLASPADCMVRIECIEPLPAARLWEAQGRHLGSIAKPLRWFGFDDERNQWLPLDSHSAGSHHWFAAVMQLVDRRGPIAAADLDRFLDGVQKISDEFMSVPASMPARVETLTRAAELDAFCAGVDIQIGLNVVAGEEPFPGTKLRGLAEAQGWLLREDGAYHAEDPDGDTMFTMTNLEASVFVASELKDLQTRGVTLLLDVPRTPFGPQTFDRMLVSARKIAEALRGEVVDDNRTAFGETQARLVRGQIEQFQQRMAESGIPAGGELARRLFSA